MWTIQFTGTRESVKEAVLGALIASVSSVPEAPPHGVAQWSGPGFPVDAPVVDDPRSLMPTALTGEAAGDDNLEVFVWVQRTIVAMIDLLPDATNGVTVDARGSLDSILNLAVSPLVLAA